MLGLLISLPNAPLREIDFLGPREPDGARKRLSRVRKRPIVQVHADEEDLRMKKHMAVGCAIIAVIMLGSCTFKAEKYAENTASDYDYISDNMKISDGVWTKNWVTIFDEEKKIFVPSVSSYRYEGLNIYLGKFHTRDLKFEVAKADGPVYIEIYMIYVDADGAEKVKLLGESERDKIFKIAQAGWNVELNFDEMPPLTQMLKFKVQKGRETIYLDAKSPG